MLEKDIERVLVEGVRAVGGIAYKFTSPGNSGVPDRIVILPGGDISFVELKTKDGKLTALQRRQIKEIRARGARVYTTYGLSGIRAFWLAKADQFRGTQAAERTGCYAEAARIEQKYAEQLRGEGYGV